MIKFTIKNMKKSINNIIGIGTIAVVLVLSYSTIFKPKQDERAQNQVLNNNNDSDVTTPTTTDSMPDSTSFSTPNTDSDIDTSDWKVYRNEEFGFELKYPTTLYLFDCSSNFYEQKSLYVHFTPNKKSNCNSPYKAINSLIAISHIKNFNKNDLINPLDEVKEEDSIIIGNKLSIQISGESEVKGDEREKLSSEPIREIIFTVVPYENNADIQIMYSRISSIKNDDNGFVVGEDLSKIYNQMLSTFKFINENDDSNMNISEWDIYRNEKYGYEMKYPKEWIIETYDGKYAETKNDQINAGWIQFSLHTKDEQKIKKYGESMVASVDVSVDDKYVTIEDYLKDFGYDFNENTLKEGRILLTRGIAKVWMNIREEDFKGQKAYVIEYSDSGYYIYFKNQNIYKISSLWNTSEINKNNILDIINTFKFIN